MAHTLKAFYYTDPATAVTVDFYSAVADNDGIAVTSYQMGIPGIEQARNNSLYSDSPRPVYSKHGTVTDVLTVDVRGSTNTALYTNLHLLAKLGEYARESKRTPTNITSAYLELKPGGSAAGEVLYANIYDCRVELPPDWANTQDARLTIEDVTVTIEHGLWRSHPPTTTSTSFTSIVAATNQARAYQAAGSAIGGDASALWHLRVQPYDSASHPAIDKLIIGFSSKAIGGAKYSAYGKLESESATLGTDTSAVADATASGGNVARCTFATVTTVADRVSKSAALGAGVHRVFARMKVTSTAVASVYVKTSEVYAGPFVNSAVAVSSTSWAIYDLGVVRVYQSNYYFVAQPTATASYYITAALTSGSGNLDIDYVFVMPTEGYITASGCEIAVDALAPLIQFDTASIETTLCMVSIPSVTARTAQPSYTVSLDPPPGECAIYWLVGTETAGVFDVGIVGPIDVSFYVSARFLMPSEV